MAKMQYISIGENLKKLRKVTGMTQNDICARLDVMGRPMSQSTYAQLEMGARNIFVSSNSY